MKHLVFVAAAAITLAACGNPAEQANELQAKAEAAIDGQTISDTAGAVIDEKAVEGMVYGAVAGAVQSTVREVVPAEELRVIGAVVDEEALARGLDKAIDGEALRGLARDAGAAGAADVAPAQ